MLNGVPVIFSVELVEAKFNRNFFVVSSRCLLKDYVSSVVFPTSLDVSFPIYISMCSSFNVERKVIFCSSFKGGGLIVV